MVTKFCRIFLLGVVCTNMSWSEKMRNRLLEAEQLSKSDAYKSCQSKAKSQRTFWPQTVASSANLSGWKDMVGTPREGEVMSATSSWDRVVFCSALSSI